MPGLGYIKGISEEAATLLEAAGVLRPVDLANQRVETLYPALQVANRYEKAFLAMPAQSQVEHWITAARELVDTIAPGVERAVIAESTPAPAVAKKPALAAPVNEAEVEAVAVEELDEEEVLIAEIVEGDALEDTDLEPAVALHHTALPMEKSTGFTADTLAHLEKIRERSEVDIGYGSPKAQDEEDIWKNVDKQSFATFDEYADGRIRVQPLQRYGGDDAPQVGAVDQNEGPERIETFVPEESISRLIRRGVNYPYPITGYLSAAFVLLFRLYMLALVIALPIALIQLGDKFGEYWLATVVFIGVFLFLGIIHLAINTKVRCRVCSCPMFYSQRCYKNQKAHLVKGLGYVSSLALHLVLFQWFRCMYCGTAIRVRGAAKTKRMEVLDARALEIGDDLDDDDTF